MCKNKFSRLDTVSVSETIKRVVYTSPEQVNNEYLIDDSCFIPMSEAVKQLGVNSSSSTNINEMYDFPTGKDDGREIPITRQSGYKDLAEISTVVAESADQIKADIEELAYQAQKQKDFEDKVKNLSSNQNTPKTE